MINCRHVHAPEGGGGGGGPPPPPPCWFQTCCTRPLQASDTSEKVGTLALAYAAHKALSPVRFPPTVALTPVVARWLGRGGGGGEGGEPSDGS